MISLFKDRKGKYAAEKVFYILPKVGVDMGKSFDRLSSSIFTVPDKKPRSCIIETLTDQVTDLTVQCVARATSVAEKNHSGVDLRKYRRGRFAAASRKAGVFSDQAEYCTNTTQNIKCKCEYKYRIWKYKY